MKIILLLNLKENKINYKQEAIYKKNNNNKNNQYNANKNF